MTIEKPDKTESQEEAFSKWLVKFQGQYWCDPDVMPKGSFDAYQMYKHYLSHGKTVDDSKVIENAGKFKEITGYDIADFDEYKARLSKKEE